MGSTLPEGVSVGMGPTGRGGGSSFGMVVGRSGGNSIGNVPRLPTTGYWAASWGSMVSPGRQVNPTAQRQASHGERDSLGSNKQREAYMRPPPGKEARAGLAGERATLEAPAKEIGISEEGDGHGLTGERGDDDPV